MPSISRPHEIAELLEHVREHAAHPWIYPLACMAGHTGARRSELIRMRVGRRGFRRRKRHHPRAEAGEGQTLDPPGTADAAARDALTAWLAVHPAGRRSFANPARWPTARSGAARPATRTARGGRRRSRAAWRRCACGGGAGPEPLTAGECHDHFKRTLAARNGRWFAACTRFGIPFISCLAAAGVDQRIIDDIVGHVSEEMRRRYRHLTPAVKSQAVLAVFNDGGPSRRPGG